MLLGLYMITCTHVSCNDCSITSSNQCGIYSVVQKLPLLAVLHNECCTTAIVCGVMCPTATSLHCVWLLLLYVTVLSKELHGG
jgi:Na+-translocating ferredoxin:NAD+ oxidoreductase RnfD subunit